MIDPVSSADLSHRVGMTPGLFEPQFYWGQLNEESALRHSITD